MLGLQNLLLRLRALMEDIWLQNPNGMQERLWDSLEEIQNFERYTKRVTEE